MVVEVKEVLEVLPELGVNLVSLAEIDLIGLCLHHLVDDLLLLAAALRPRIVLLLLHLLICYLTGLVQSELRLLLHQILQIDKVKKLLDFKLVFVVLKLLIYAVVVRVLYFIFQLLRIEDLLCVALELVIVVVKVARHEVLVWRRVHFERAVERSVMALVR